MPFFQPALRPPPGEPTLEGRTVIITGATSGIGFETARQLLQRLASTVILAVRNVSKGEHAKSTLLSDPAVRSLSPAPTVTVMHLDMSDYASVQAFSVSARSSLPRLDILLLNAGTGSIVFERSRATGHEAIVQVNYLSNVALLLGLLPLLRATAERTGGPSRVTWVGSRAHAGGLPSLVARARAPWDPAASVFAHLDDEAAFSGVSRYPDSKMLAAMFVYEFARRSRGAPAPGGDVVLNMFCPGMVDTGITDALPWYFWVVIGAVKAVRARTAEQGAWVAVNAAVVAGEESHGKFLMDMECVEACDFLKSEDGRKTQEVVWNQTLEEVSKYVDVPQWMEMSPSQHRNV